MGPGWGVLGRLSAHLFFGAETLSVGTCRRALSHRGDSDVHASVLCHVMPKVGISLILLWSRGGSEQPKPVSSVDFVKHLNICPLIILDKFLNFFLSPVSWSLPKAANFALGWKELELAQHREGQGRWRHLVASPIALCVFELGPRTV